MTPQFEHGGPRYLDSQESIVPGRPVLFGVGYDGTTSFRPGTRSGPDAIRMLSVGVEDYCPVLDRDFGQAPFADLGNIEIPYGAPAPVVERAQAATTWIAQQGGIPFMLGGEHSCTVGPVRALAKRYPNLGVIQVDAHADLRQDYLGEPLSHACAMRRCLDALDSSSAMLQVGIRSGTRKEFEELRRTERLVEPTAQALGEALKRLAKRPLYLTLDLDAFDPSLMPGTGTPEPGGLTWEVFQSLLSVIPWERVVGMDAVELSPALDATGCSTVLAAKAVRQMLLSR